MLYPQVFLRQVVQLVVTCVAGAVGVSYMEGAGGNVFSSGPSPTATPQSPAKYKFKWDVNDPPSGNFYGHQEQRLGDNTQGRSGQIRCGQVYVVFRVNPLATYET